MENTGFWFELGLAIAMLSICSYAARFFFYGLRLKPWHGRLLTGSLMLLALLAAGSRHLVKQQTILQSIGSLWAYKIGAWSYYLILMLGFTVCLIFIFRQATYRLSNKISGSLPNYQRRKLFLRLTRLSFIGVTAPTFAFATHQAFLEPELKEVDIPLAHLPEALVGFRICQLSDLHLTPDYDPAALRKLILRINDLRPDIIALTGDITDGYTHEFKDLFTLLASLKARLGVFFVTGNHEYYWGAEAWCDAYSEIGFQVMNNRHQVLEVNEGKILIAGISDPSAKYHLAHHASSADAALRDAPLDMVRILLAHQPASLYQASHLSYDLQLSGHTHGGQLLPLGWLARLSQPCLEGLNWIASRWVYVNCGAGYSGPPLRLGTRSEIAVLRLVSK